MNKKFIYTFVVIGLLVGLIVSFQLKSNVVTSGTFVADEVVARQKLLEEFLGEQGYLQSRISNLRAQIAEAEEEIASATTEINFEALESLKAEVGLTGIQGPGLMISLSDSQNALRDGNDPTAKELVQASDIRDIVNVLFASNAEAVMVNEHRVVANSPISSIGTTVLVNNSYIAPPFIISAVGDTDIMLQRFLNESLLKPLHERSLKEQIIMTVVVKQLVEAPVYSGDLKTNYLNLVN